METHQSFQQIQALRKGQKELFSLSRLLTLLSPKTYANLLSWVTEFADHLDLSLSTKCLTRIYFDLALNGGVTFAHDDDVLPIVTCLSLAIKFNENREISDIYTLRNLLKIISIEYSDETLINSEISVWSALHFRMMFTTTEDFLNTFLALFPYYSKMFKLALPKYIELGLIHPLACEFTSEEIVYGAVLALIEVSGVDMKDRQAKKLLKMTKCWIRAAKMKDLIKFQIKEAEVEPQDN